MEGDFVRQLAMSQRQGQAARDGRTERKSQRDIVDEIAEIEKRLVRLKKHSESTLDPRAWESIADSVYILDNQKKALVSQLGTMVREAQMRDTPGVSETYMRGFGEGQPTPADTMAVLQMALANMQGAEELVGPGASEESRGEGWRLADLAARKERTFGEARGTESQQLADRLRKLLEQKPWGYRPQPGGEGYFDE